MTEVSKETAVAERDRVYSRLVEYSQSLPDRLTVDDAISETHALSMWIDSFDIASMGGKFFLGLIAHRANPEWRTKRAYGEDIIGKIASAKGINPNILREARRVAEFFGFDFPLYYQWLTESDSPKNWYHAQNLIRAHSSTDVHSPDDLASILANQITRVGVNMQTLREMAERGEIGYDEVAGIEQTFLDELREFEENREKILDDQAVQDNPKRKSLKYLEFLKAQPCQITGVEEEVEIHHVEQGGEGETGSDYGGIPVYWEVHRFIEDNGHRAAEEKYGIRFGQIVARLLHEYFTGSTLRFPRDIAH